MFSICLYHFECCPNHLLKYTTFYLFLPYSLSFMFLSFSVAAFNFIRLFSILLSLLTQLPFKLLFLLIFFRQDEAKHMCKKMLGGTLNRTRRLGFTQCCFCGEPKNSFDFIPSEIDIHGRTGYNGMRIDARKKVNFSAGLI